MTRMDMGIVYFMLVKERNCGRTNESVNRLVQFESLIGWLSISIKIRVSFIVCRTDELSLKLGVLFMYSVLI